MFVPALFQLCSSRALKKLFVIQRCSSCSSCSSTSAHVCANRQITDSRNTFFSRAYTNRLEHLEQLEQGCFYYGFIFFYLEQSWNRAGTAA